VTPSAYAFAPYFDDVHRVLSDRLRGLLDGPLGPLRASDDPRAVAEFLGAAWGLYALVVPSEGAAVDVRSLVVVREALAGVSPLADSIFAVQGLGAHPIVRAGTAAQRQVLTDVVAGRTVAAFALTEPEAGSDVASLQTTARREGDGWVLDGEKWLISNVPMADYQVVFANAAPELGKKGVSAFVVPSDAEGLTREALPMEGHALGRLGMRGCRVGDGALLGAVGDGMRLALETLDTFRVSVGAAANGMAARALALSVARVQGRVQFGVPLASQQMVRAYVAEMATSLDAARLLVARAAHAKDTGVDDASTAVAMAKLYATESAQTVIDKAVQLHGGSGVLDDSPLAMLYRAVRPLRIYEGTTEIQKLIIARAVLGR